jgi:hypothetical protein
MRLSTPRGVAAIVDDDTVYAAFLPAGPIVVLDGIAALIWTEANVGDRDDVAERVAASTGSPVEEVRPHVDAFVTELVDRGLLEEQRA